MNQQPEQNKTAELQMVNVASTLVHRCLQFVDGEITGFDMQMFESMLPILMRPFMQTTSLQKQLEEIKRLALFHKRENDALTNENNELQSEVERLKEENQQLKCLAHEGLPNNCIGGHDEVKFCHYRQGDGNMCKHCSNYK